LNDRRLAKIRNTNIGFVFQTFNLINRTSAMENVAIPLVYARRRGVRALAMKSLARVGLAERAYHKPSELSGGERQRVAIARALVNSPAMLLADEPTGNLDSETSREIMKVFRDLHTQGHTVVTVTHDPNVAAEAERIVHITDGRIDE
jgi:putative ABC transport system ATP-binding protein